MTAVRPIQLAVPDRAADYRIAATAEQLDQLRDSGWRCVGVGAHGYVLTPPGTDDH